MKKYKFYYNVIVYDIVDETNEKTIVCAGRCKDWKDTVKSVKKLQSEYKGQISRSANIYVYRKCDEIGLLEEIDNFYVRHGLFGKEIQ